MKPLLGYNQFLHTSQELSVNIRQSNFFRFQSQTFLDIFVFPQWNSIVYVNTFICWFESSKIPILFPLV